MKIQANRFRTFVPALLLLFFIVIGGLAAGCAPASSAPSAHATVPVSTQQADAAEPMVVGFDLDDTILFSTPAFDQAFKSDEKPFSRKFWEIVNSSDRRLSTIKRRTEELIRGHERRGDEIYVVTGREPYLGDELRSFLNERLGIKRDHVIFVGIRRDDGSQAGIAAKNKSEIMRELKMKVF